eukprot:14411361-Alexandrium_andersonii.AAC.1
MQGEESWKATLVQQRLCNRAPIGVLQCCRSPDLPRSSSGLLPRPRTPPQPRASGTPKVPIGR